MADPRQEFDTMEDHAGDYTLLQDQEGDMDHGLKGQWGGHTQLASHSGAQSVFSSAGADKRGSNPRF
jgi:hypothetical protein